MPFTPSCPHCIRVTLGRPTKGDFSWLSSCFFKIELVITLCNRSPVEKRCPGLISITLFAYCLCEGDSKCHWLQLTSCQQSPRSTATTVSLFSSVAPIWSTYCILSNLLLQSLCAASDIAAGVAPSLRHQRDSDSQHPLPCTRSDVSLNFTSFAATLPLKAKILQTSPRFIFLFLLFA